MEEFMKKNKMIGKRDEKKKKEHLLHFIGAYPMHMQNELSKPTKNSDTLG